MDPVVGGEVQVPYLCGACGQQNVIKAQDPIRCRSCGYRILYKVRTKRMIQFQAR
jgi:DNA-directed RNA polymerase I, II, and III subunit RPABC4